MCAVLLFGPDLKLGHQYVGCIDPFCSPAKLAHEAFVSAYKLCMRYYGRAPGCRIHTIDRRRMDKPARRSSRKVSAQANGQMRIDLSGADALVPPTAKSGSKQASFDKVAFFASPAERFQPHPDDITIVYIPEHLFHMFFELLKNAMRALAESTPPEQTQLEPIDILIVNAEEDVVIRVSRSFHYLLSTFSSSFQPLPL
ncbi:unnamed protein product [Protopolystoma xenopodis]|uniref:Protein-serine/threonine kinase n=1 Tax=Protopolystoma xenopodis TaxID=117903 RepID=A0A3S5CDT9_9PLAT|nr:unnamed protein product [Protopolystoma xenopodis]